MIILGNWFRIVQIGRDNIGMDRTDLKGRGVRDRSQRG